MSEIKISSSFLRNVFELPKNIQKEIFDFIDKITVNHPSKIPGLRYEKMQNTSSGLTIYSARITEKYRVLIHEDKNELHLLRIGNHEPTYDKVNKIDVLTIMNKNDISVSTRNDKDLGKLFAGVSNKEFAKLGIKTEPELKAIRSINTESEYNKLKETKMFSSIVFDNLDAVLAELSINELVSDYRTRYKKAKDLLFENVIEPGLRSTKITEETKKHIRSTKRRLEKKESLEEIIHFYYDALDSEVGQSIADEFHKNDLKAFEDFTNDILKIIKGY